MADNFSVSVQNTVVNVTDHQDAKIRTVDALQHVISKCNNDINLFVKVSFGNATGGAPEPAFVTPQVKLFKFIFILYYYFHSVGIKHNLKHHL